jgi:hypothetical protein
MKSKTAQATGERRPDPVVANQPGTATLSSKSTGPFLDDLHGRITIRAYELYVQRGCREGCALDDWLDAEREIVSHEFPVSPTSKSSASYNS